MGVYGSSAQPSPPRDAALTILQSSTQLRSRRGRDRKLDWLAADRTVVDELGSRHSHAIVEAGPRRRHPRLWPAYHSLKGRTSSPCTVPCNHAVRVAKVGRPSCRCAQHARATSYTAPGINLSTRGIQMNGGHTTTRLRASWSRTCRSTRCCDARSRPRASSVARIATAVDGAGNAVVADSAHAPVPGGRQSPRRRRCLPRLPPRLTGEAAPRLLELARNNLYRIFGANRQA
jgi:hypothetical protein